MITRGPEPWKHQRDACSFVYRRRGTLLDMAMGTGKTRVVVDFVQNTAGDHGLTLIICPLAVARVWPRELAKYCAVPFYDVDLSYGSAISRTAALAHCLTISETRPRFAVVNYDCCHREPLASALLKAKVDCLVLDECHKIKAPGGVASRYVARLAKGVKKVIGLSGTPMSQGPLDIYGQMRAISPDLFGTSFQRFRNQYAVMGGYQGYQVMGYKNMPEFTEKMNRVCFKVGSDVLDLPEAVHQEIPVQLPAKAANIYKQLESELMAEWESDDGDEQGIEASNALVKLLRLQQLAGGFLESSGSVQTMHTEKIKAVVELVEDMDWHEKIVIFCRFTAEIDALKEALEGMTSIPGGAKCYLLTGKQKEVEAWEKSTKGVVLLVQISAGGVGIDLTAARYCIYNSLCYSLADYEQSLARVHRPGQTRPVTYYHIVADGTVDNQIYAALQSKRDVISAIREHIIDRRRM